MGKSYLKVLTENRTSVLRIPNIITEQSENRFKMYDIGSDHQSSSLLNNTDKVHSFIQGLEVDEKEPWMNTKMFQRMVDEVEDFLKAKKNYGQHLYIVTEKEIYTFTLNGFDVPDIQITKAATLLKEKYGDIHEFWLTTLLTQEDENKSGFMAMGRHLVSGDPKENCYYVCELKTKTGIFGKIKNIDIIEGKIYLFHSFKAELDSIINAFAKGLGY
jgi:hypothetical protein